MNGTGSYHGRFAPTPSGPLHFGSVVAALGSYLQARQQGGRWTIRIEDLDRPRMQAGADSRILHDLERLGLEWDGTPIYQSQRLSRYFDMLAELTRRGQTFACGCTRRETAGIYPGTCRDGLPDGRKARSLRLRVPPRTIVFDDALQGRQNVDLSSTTGDFVLRRADGIIAYHLASVVDDGDDGVTEIVRGADLLDACAPQILLQQLLGYPTPRYMHLPVVYDSQGRKVSKQNHAPPITDQSPARVLLDALAFLGQQPEPALGRAATAEILDWARANWRPQRTGAAAAGNQSVD